MVLAATTMAVQAWTDCWLAAFSGVSDGRNNNAVFLVGAMVISAELSSSPLGLGIFAKVSTPH